MYENLEQAMLSMAGVPIHNPVYWEPLLKYFKEEAITPYEYIYYVVGLLRTPATVNALCSEKVKTSFKEYRRNRIEDSITTMKWMDNQVSSRLQQGHTAERISLDNTLSGPKCYHYSLSSMANTLDQFKYIKQARYEIQIKPEYKDLLIARFNREDIC